ncbi:hypothetical protein CIPAW_03G173000 [Carya illinoinensis]|uniref:Retrotransposon Copia-like N-terminal domain-containing protein n=1 Tax=Carya illinoinensis TaxID=32201 RepID=A0A8T1R3E6_CARIL|nr:hypothetical protein CIPAW_03G173000 [Carya illinoinensis]
MDSVLLPPCIDYVNVGNFLTLHLKQDNYSFWREQIIGLAERQDLVSLLTGELSAPAQVISCPEGSCDGQLQINPEYNKWRWLDRLLRAN